MWNKFYFGLNYCLLSRSSYHQDDGYNLRDLRDKINATIAHSEHSMNNDPESRFELQTKVNRSQSEQRNRFVFLISRHIFILTIQDLLRVTQVSRPWVGPQSVRRDTFMFLQNQSLIIWYQHWTSAILFIFSWSWYLAVIIWVLRTIIKTVTIVTIPIFSQLSSHSLNSLKVTKTVSQGLDHNDDTGL